MDILRKLVNKHIMPKGTSKNKYLGKFQKNKKVLNELEQKVNEQINEISVKNAKLNEEEVKVRQINIELKEISNTINTKRRKLDRKKVLLEEIYKQIDSAQEGISNNTPKVISKTVAQRRKLNPTSPSLAAKAKIIRRRETFNTCLAIHGGSSDNHEPVIDGMLDTITSKFDANLVSKKILVSKPSVVKSIKHHVLKSSAKEYCSSEENLLRSLNMYYAHSVLGKRKYLSIRKANRGATYRGTRVSNYVPYKMLADRINSVDIGNLKDINTLDDASEGELGVYREPAEYIIRLAQFYIKVNENRIDKLHDFPYFKPHDPYAKLFVLAFGGDHAPICGMSILISFLNVGKRIGSSSEQFLLLGGDVGESSKLVSKFVCKLIADIKYLESKTFDIECLGRITKCEFRLRELPNDMKMLCFLAGELSNAATYFSTFGNVTKSDANDLNKEYGKDWKAFSFAKRLEDVKKVADFKKNVLSKSTAAEATKRSKLTAYIGSLKSRQETYPIVDSYIDYAKAEPLHLKNNTVKERFMQIFKLCLSQSNLKCIKNFNDVPTNSLFYKFVDFVHFGMNCNFLAKKIKTWFNETSAINVKDFSFRFRGKESFLYMKHFPSLIQMILNSIENDELKFRLPQIFFQSLRLRAVLSYSVRIIDFDQIMLSDMKLEATSLFRSCCLFEQSISPSLWTLCHVAPFHAEKCLVQYNFGLGCNTMEGREQKHQQITKYSKNTTFQNRWPLIFRHEFLQLIYLREHNFDIKRYIKKAVSYVPPPAPGICNQCRTLRVKEGLCSICDSIWMKKVENIVKK